MIQVAPFQGLKIVGLSTQGGAALCPGLVCCAPSGQIIKGQSPLARIFHPFRREALVTNIAPCYLYN